MHIQYVPPIVFLFTQSALYLHFATGAVTLPGTHTHTQALSTSAQHSDICPHLRQVPRNIDKLTPEEVIDTNTHSL